MLPPLPDAPGFPVYGLGPKYDGLRWLALWNDPKRPWTITLGHGEPDSADCIYVTTQFRTTPDSRGETRGERPLLFDAATDAVWYLVNATEANGQKRKPLAEREMALLELDRDGQLTLRGWQPTTIFVDDRPFRSFTRTVGHATATVLEASPVAITVASRARQPNVPLVEVSHRLIEYRPPQAGDYPAPGAG